LIDSKRTKRFVIQVTGASFIAGSHRIRGPRRGNEPNAPFFQQMPTSRVVVVRMCQDAVSYVVGRQTPISHVRKNLVHGIAAPAVDHNQSVTRPDNIRIAIVPHGALDVKSDSVQVPANLKNILEYL